MFAGTFFWFRNDLVFSHPDWRRIAPDRYGAEAWPSSLFTVSEGFSVYQLWPETLYPLPNPYNPAIYERPYEDEQAAPADPVASAEPIAGWMSPVELRYLADLAGSLPPQARWVEVGSYAGRSLLATGLSLPPGAELTAIDSCVGVPPQSALAVDVASSLQQVLSMVNARGVRARLLVEPSADAARHFDDASLDVVFVDGDHTAEGVRADITAWLPKLKPGGVLCGHDYLHPTYPGVQELVDQLLPDRSLVPDSTIWAVRRPAAPATQSGRMRYLTIAAIYKCETRWLREWIEYHRNRGVEHFLLFNNDDDPAPSEAILAPYLAEGLVEVVRWPGRLAQPSAQRAAVERLRGKTRWMGFLDLDEFVLPRQCDDLREALQNFEQHGGLAANWRLFGSSGLQFNPQSQINELLRCSQPEHALNHHIKSFVDPALVIDFADPHFFRLAGGHHTVDEEHQPVQGYLNPRCPQQVLRVNHYSIRSLEDFLTKSARGEGDRPRIRDIQHFVSHDTNDCFDDEIARRFGHEVSLCVS
jgi:predicted O-methyltransferase YrrM